MTFISGYKKQRILFRNSNTQKSESFKAMYIYRWIILMGFRVTDLFFVQWSEKTFINDWLKLVR